MAELIEIAFDDATETEKAIRFIFELVSTSEIKNYNSSNEELENKLNLRNIESIKQAITNLLDGTISINFKTIRIRSVIIEDFTLVIYKWKLNQLFDIYLLLDEPEFKKVDSILFWQTFATELASLIGAREFYCGLDPASDEDTRFFTDQTLGPLKF